MAGLLRSAGFCTLREAVPDEDLQGVASCWSAALIERTQKFLNLSPICHICLCRSAVTAYVYDNPESHRPHLGGVVIIVSRRSLFCNVNASVTRREDAKS